MELKTNKELLEELGELNYSRAIYNALDSNTTTHEAPKAFLKETPKHQEASETLLSVFTWYKSLEGHEFWAKNYYNLKKQGK